MENQRIVPILLTGNSLQIAQSDHDFENISCTWPILLGFYAGSVHVRSATCAHTSISSAYVWRAFPVSVVHSLLKNTALPSGRCPLPPHEKATAYSRSYVVVISYTFWSAVAGLQGRCPEGEALYTATARQKV